MAGPEPLFTRGSTWLHDLKNRAISLQAQARSGGAEEEVERLAADFVLETEQFLRSARTHAKGSDDLARLDGLLEKPLRSVASIRSMTSASLGDDLSQLEEVLRGSYDLGRDSLLYRIVDRALLFRGGSGSAAGRALLKVISTLIPQPQLTRLQVVAGESLRGTRMVVVVDDRTGATIPLGIVIPELWSSRKTA